MTMVHHNFLDSLIAGLKQTTAICMIAQQGFLGWFCSLALELGLAHSGAVHPANFPMAGPWCQCQRQGTAPSPADAHFATSKKAALEHFGMVGDGKKASHFMHLLRNALHLTLQARCLHSFRLPLCTQASRPKFHQLTTPMPADIKKCVFFSYS
jgi:hypothetical protein